MPSGAQRCVVIALCNARRQTITRLAVKFANQRDDDMQKADSEEDSGIPRSRCSPKCHTLSIACLGSKTCHGYVYMLHAAVMLFIA